MDLHSPQNMAVAFEPSCTPFWSKTNSTSFLYHHHHTPTSPTFYNLTVPLMGPTRTIPTTHRSDPLDSSERIPRPPNAWILYRSDKLKEMAPPAPGKPRPLQADISKTISAMWKAETPEVRARYERLSDIKKAEHLLIHPDYRFHPVKKAEKERIRAEKLAEKERDRLARGGRPPRKSKPRPRVDFSKPLFTTDARPGPPDSSPSASGSSTSSTVPSTSQQPFATVSQSTPSADHSTPSSNHSVTPVPLTSGSSPYPPSPSVTTIPPLVAPQPAVPQRPPSASDWSGHQQHILSQGNEQEFNDLWLDQVSFPDMSQFSTQSEFLPVPMSNQPLGWSVGDPSPLTDQPFYNERINGVLSPTANPYTFHLADLNYHPEDLFDGVRNVKIAMGSTSMAPLPGDGQYQPFTGLLANLDHPTERDLSAVAGTSQLAQSTAHLDQCTSAFPTGLEEFSFDSFVDEAVPQGEAIFNDLLVPLEDVPDAPDRQRQPATVPYAPPAGAYNSSRRVAAEWRHIRSDET